MSTEKKGQMGGRRGSYRGGRLSNLVAVDAVGVHMLTKVDVVLDLVVEVLDFLGSMLGQTAFLDLFFYLTTV